MATHRKFEAERLGRHRPNSDRVKQALAASLPLLIVFAAHATDTNLLLDDKDGKELTFEAAAGERLAVSLRNQGGPVALVLEDPSGEQRRQWIRDPGEGSDSICPRPQRPAAAWVADLPGTWKLRVLPPEGEPPFEVTAVRDEPRPATDADRLAWAADLEDAKVSALLDEGKAVEAAAAARTLAALREQELSGQPLLLASDLGYLGVRFFLSAACKAGAWDTAADLVQKALDLRERALPQSDACVAESLSLIASIAYARGRFEEGERFERRSLAIREKGLPARPEAWRGSVRDVGILLLQQGRYSEAEVFLRRALDSAEKAGAPDEIADALNNLAELHRNQNRYDDALAELTRARKLADGAPAPDPSFRSDLLAALAGVHLDKASYDEAERYAKLYLDLLSEHEELATPDHVAIGKVNLGEIYRRQGRLADAEPLLVEALETGRDAFCPENPKLLYFRVDAALLYAEVGKPELAEALYRESLTATEQALGPDHPDVAANLNELAGMLVAQRRFEEARDLYRRALAIREQVFGADHPVTSVTRARLAQALFQGGSKDLPAILSSVARARRSLDAASVFPEEGIDAASFESEVLERLGRKTEARRALGEALRSVERLRPRRGGGEGARADFVRRRLDDYDRMVAYALQARDVAAAFEYVERSRARALLDLLTSGTGDLRASVDPEVRARLTAKETEAAAALAEAQSRAAYERARTDLSPAERRARLLPLDRQADAAARRLQVVADDFKNNSPLWRDEVTATGAPVALSAVSRNIVPPDGVLLAYRVGRRSSTLFIVPAHPGKATAVSLEVSAEDGAALGIPAGPLTARALDAVLNGDPAVPGVSLLRRIAEPPGFFTEDAPATIAELHALRRVLLPGRAWEQVEAAEEAVVIPDGALAQLPFEALVTAPGPSWADSKLWLDSGPAIRYAASATSLASVLARAATGAVRAPSVLSVSDPIFDPAKVALARLPGTARESAAVALAFREAGFPDAVVLLTGPGATEAEVKRALPGKRFLHLATHGIVEPGRNELLAGLALTDGMLQLFEIQELKLDADLVVLSACDTSVGRRVAGEGVFSLGRGFFAAGARRVVASLWPVDDDASARLIGDLFRAIAQAEAAGRDPRPAGALRDAKRTLRAEAATSAPFYWAAFTCAGIR